MSVVMFVGACGQVDSALDGLGFDSQCWPCVDVSGKLCISHCLCPPSVMGSGCTDPRLDQWLQAAVRPLPGEVKSEERAVTWISGL